MEDILRRGINRRLFPIQLSILLSQDVCSQHATNVIWVADMGRVADRQL